MTTITTNPAQIVRGIEADIDAEIMSFSAIASKFNVSVLLVTEIYEQMVLRAVNSEWETYHTA